LKAYVNEHDAGWVGYEKVMISLSRNDYEPDIVFFGKEKAARLSPDQLQCPAPDFIVEILSPSTRRNDRGIKFIDYAAHGVGEYWIVDPVKEALEQYVLSGKEYELKLKADSGKIHSAQVPGFVIPVRALFDVAENRKALRALLSR
jgi:Uma2 family endonuclease